MKEKGEKERTNSQEREEEEKRKRKGRANCTAGRSVGIKAKDESPRGKKYASKRYDPENNNNNVANFNGSHFDFSYALFV